MSDGRILVYTRDDGIHVAPSGCLRSLAGAEKREARGGFTEHWWWKPDT
ncbi:MAG TPA: hypothetical protein VFZ37_07750 [Jiangellaceae bacterium]